MMGSGTLQPMRSHRVEQALGGGQTTEPLVEDQQPEESSHKSASEKFFDKYRSATIRFKQLDNNDHCQTPLIAENQIREMNRAATASLVQTTGQMQSIEWTTQRNKADAGDIESLNDSEMDLSTQVKRMSIERQHNRFRQGESSQIKSILSWGDAAAAGGGVAHTDDDHNP